ncbi:hypothetical protein BpHYR1_024399 [Brachionus plicatilis]|uniref:Uncharacterized protein n=1 Tax=Brachionus plicatilis TaxID=10195 RepID=A0A3M7QWH0_BRAPC|nr:hypothetical protein BpHYR1_024399 [Brachionus plicatilis]
MLNKSNNEIELCSKNFEIKNKWSSNGSDNLKKANRSANKSKLNSILNRTLSDSILNKKSTSLSNTFQSHKRELCLSRKNSTNRRSILFHPCSTALNTSCNTGSPAPPSPSLLQVQSPNSNFFGQYNYRNKLKYHRSSWCILNNNLTGGLNTNHADSANPVSGNENSSFPCSLSSSLSPSPITILNNHASNSNLNGLKNNGKPLSSPKLQLTPASSNGPGKLLKNII